MAIIVTKGTECLIPFSGAISLLYRYTLKHAIYHFKAYKFKFWVAGLTR